LAAGRYKTSVKYLLTALEGFESVGAASLESELVTRAFLVQAYESLDMSAAATEHCLAIGARKMVDPNQNLEPLFRASPEFPMHAFSLGREEWEDARVDVAFTVDENGFVQDARTIDLQGDKAFERAALKAAERFRYAPRYQDGEPVATYDVKTRFSFKVSR
jgi:TonB family protein